MKERDFGTVGEIEGERVLSDERLDYLKRRYDKMNLKRAGITYGDFVLKPEYEWLRERDLDGFPRKPDGVVERARKAYHRWWVKRHLERSWRHMVALEWDLGRGVVALEGGDLFHIPRGDDRPVRGRVH